MIVAFNCGCPCRASKLVKVLVDAFGYSSEGIPDNCIVPDGSNAIRIDTDRKKILGHNPAYPDATGDRYGCIAIISLLPTRGEL